METIEATEIEILIEGKVVKSNLDTFCAQLKEVVKSLDRELVTDGDFEAADKDAKFLKSAEKSLQAAKDEALKQAEDIQKLFAAIDDVGEEARQARLGLERQIKARKEERRLDIIESGLRTLDFENIHFRRSQIEAAVKGKKSFESMEVAVGAEVEKIVSTTKTARHIIERFESENGKTLTPDREQLEQMQTEPLRIELERRFERAQAEAERKRLEAEKAELERAQKAQAEAERKSEPLPAPTKPEPTKEQPTPIAPESKPDEMAVFKKRVMDAFAGVKEARAQLKNPENIERAQRFAIKVSAAFQDLMGGAG